MSDSTRKKLEQAFELLQEDDFERAVPLLRDILREEPTNADAWWLMANSVEDPRDAREALINVLKNDPMHARARETLETLNEQFPPNDEELRMLIDLENETGDIDLSELEEPLSEDELFNMFDEDADVDLSVFEEPKLDDEDDPFAGLLDDDEDATTDEKKSRRKRQKKERKPREKKERSGGILRPVLLITVIVLVAAGAFVALGSNTEDGDPGQPDFVQLVAVEDAVAGDDLTNLVAEVQSSAQSTLDGGAAAFVVAEETGNTVYVQSCVCIATTCQGTPASDLPAVIERSFISVAQTVGDNPDNGVSQAGVDIFVCESTDTVYRATVSVDDVLTYLSTQNLEQFRNAWNVVAD